MKINPVMCLISLAVAALAGYGFFAANSGDEYRLVVTIGGGLCLFVTLGGFLALSSPHGGTGNIRALSAVFFVIFTVEHLIVSFLPTRLPPYIIITGIFLLVYIIVCYGVVKALK